MIRDEFNKVFDTYCQQAIKAFEQSTGQQVTALESNRLKQLRQHVQEWKQHYGQQEQATQQIKAKYQSVRQSNSGITELEHRDLVAREERECQAIAASFEVKRERIWERHQVELRINKISR